MLHTSFYTYEIYIIVLYSNCFEVLHFDHQGLESIPGYWTMLYQ